MIRRDIEMGLKYFKAITVNVFIDNGTSVKQDRELVQWFVEEFGHLTEDSRVEMLLDNGIFTILAFWGVFPTEILWEIFCTTYVMKWIVAFFDTPFVYLADHLKNNGKISELQLSKAA